MSKIIESIDLAFQEGSSNKEYHLQLIEDGKTYRVDFQYGRIGSTLNTGTKIADVDLAAAQKAYNKVKGEKTGKGYQVTTGSGTSGTTYQSGTATKSSEASGEAPIITMPARKFGGLAEAAIIPQLPNPIEEEALEGYLLDDRYGASEKKDGKSLMLYKASGSVRATNKKGKDCGYPKEFEQGLVNVDQIVANGEGIGQTLYLYDLLESNGEDIRSLGYQKRFERLFWLKLRGGCEVVPVAVGVAEKRALYNKLVAEKREGIIFKLLDEPWVAGKAGHMVKQKFYSELSAKVCAGRKGKNSIGLELLNENGVWKFRGYCTVPESKMPIPMGSVAEIRYLYVQGQDGHLYQPCFKELRDDIDLSECVAKQIKFKPEDD